MNPIRCTIIFQVNRQPEAQEKKKQGKPSAEVEQEFSARIMEEEIQGGVSEGNWWNSSRNLFRSSPCSSAVNELGSVGWFNHGMMVDIKTARSISDDSAGSPSDGGGSIVLQDAVQKPHQPSSNGNMYIASTLQMMGASLSSSTTTDDWNHELLHDSVRSQENYSHMLPPPPAAAAGLNSSMNCRQETVDDWSTGEFSAESSISSFKQVTQSFPLEQQLSNSFGNSSTSQCAATCQGISASFPLNSASYSYTSSLLQTLFDTDSQPQQSLLDNQGRSYSSSPNYRMNSTEFLPSLSKASAMVKPASSPKQQPANNFQFINNTPFWNATAAASGDIRPSFLPSTQPQLIPSSFNKAKLNPHNVTAKHHNEKSWDTESVAEKVSNEPAFKRPRIETPSPLPTFKVRKEKLGDRVTALQQLVSPFGKTDTASVLHEAIEYIKLLHDQVTVLSTPYLKNGSPPLQRQQAADKIRDQEEPIKDLKSRGLCLVPVSSTFPVAAETSPEFWAPTFGANFR